MTIDLNRAKLIDSNSVTILKKKDWSLITKSITNID